MSNHRQKGNLGESIAVNYLENNGYKIIRRNFYTPYGEIDIIAETEDCLVFVEVKLRANETFGTVLEQLTTTKMQRIIKSAESYLSEVEGYTEEYRFDYIALLAEGRDYKITHIENAFGIDY